MNYVGPPIDKKTTNVNKQNTNILKQQSKSTQTYISCTNGRIVCLYSD